MSDDTNDQQKRLRNLAWIVMGLIIALLFILFGVQSVPRVQDNTSPHYRNCTSNLKQIGIALLTYHETYKCFPPAYVADAKGKPMHSWRVLLLPFFEEQEFKELYLQYKLDEPWNSANNSQFAERIAKRYRCPNSLAPPTSVSYVAVVGPETMWPGPTSTRLHDLDDGLKRAITDGSNNSIAIVETSDPSFHSLEPRDLTVDQAMQRVKSAGAPAGIRSQHPGGINILFADGSVHFLDQEIPTEKLRALLTIAGREDAEILRE